MTHKKVFSALMLTLALCYATCALSQTKEELDQQLWNASADGELTTVKSDIQQGANVNWPSPSEGGAPALEPASANGHLSVVQTLIANGANVNQADQIRKKTALLAASFNSQDPIVSYLVTVPGINLNWHALNQWTAAMDAAWVGDLHIVKTLVAYGADVTTPNKYGETPLAAAELALDNCYISPGPFKVCPVTQGDSKATEQEYEALVTYLESLQ